MHGIGWLSILPPIIAITLAIRTKQVYLSLGLYIWLGWTLIHGGSLPVQLPGHLLDPVETEEHVLVPNLSVC